MPKKLTPKQERFVREYLIDLNATAAYKRAGYAGSGHGAEVNAHKLLRSTEVRKAVQAAQAAQLERADLSAVRVLEEMRRLALVDVRTLFDPVTGNLRAVKDLTAEQGAAIASVEVLIKNAQAGDNKTDTVHKIRLWDKPRALEMLAKHFGLLVEKIEHSGGMTIAHELPE